ncbi:MAG: porin family protein [Bacteroidota bacterium]|nr:porin family protein [Bacteroidota bacterium]
MIHETRGKGVKYSRIIVGIIGLFVSCVHAQSLDIGARVGMNLAYYENINFAGDMPREPAAGFIGGIQSDYWIKPSWALSGQILYVQSKTEISYSDGIPQSGMTGQRSVYTENFLEIPVEIKLRFTIDHDLQIYAFAGGTADFLLTAFKTNYSGAGMQSVTQDYTTLDSSRPI